MIKHERLARYLSLAYIAAHLGTTLRTAQETYSDEAIGDYWFQLAERVHRDLNKTLIIGFPLPTERGK